MKKVVLLLTCLLVGLVMYGQNSFKYPIYVGKDGVGGAIKLNGATSGSVTLLVPAIAGTTTFQFPTTNGSNGYALTTNGAGVLSWTEVTPIVITDVRNEIADSLNVLRPLVIMVSDTSSMLSRYISRGDTSAMLNGYQSTLVSGTNLKTVNGETLLGGGNIVIEGGEGGDMVYPSAGIPISSGLAWSTSITNNSVQWDSSYVARLRWDGGSTNLVAATGRTSLGGTTVGQNLFTLTNPDAIRFIRLNADNTVTALSAANFKTALSLTAADVSLGNVTNESKATMFTSPTFTTQVTLPATTYVPSGGTFSFDTGDITLTHSANTLTLGGGNLALGANSLTLTGSIGTTGARVSKGWFTDLEVTNAIAMNITGNAATVTGFTRNSGTVTLSGGHGITLTTTGITSLTLPTSGTLVANPMSAVGDIIIGGTAGAPTRLTAGTNGYVLTMASGSPAWAITTNSALETRIDSIVTILADTMNIEELLLIDLDADSVATKAYSRSLSGVTIGNVRDEIADSLNVLRPLYVAVADTSDMLAKYALTSEIPDAGTSVGDVRDEIADSLNVLRSDLKTADSDTIPIFIFGIGSGAAADTANFNNDRIIGTFFNSGSDTLHVTELRAILKAGTGTETIGVEIHWGGTFLTSAGHLNNAALTVNSHTSDITDTSFDHNDIPPDVWVWGILSGASKDNKPTFLALTMTGYRRNRSY